jgi:hypothetical protein
MLLGDGEKWAEHGPPRPFLPVLEERFLSPERFASCRFACAQVGVALRCRQGGRATGASERYRQHTCDRGGFVRRAGCRLDPVREL